MTGASCMIVRWTLRKEKPRSAVQLTFLPAIGKSNLFSASRSASLSTLPRTTERVHSSIEPRHHCWVSEQLSLGGTATTSNPSLPAPSPSTISFGGLLYAGRLLYDVGRNLRPPRRGYWVAFGCR